MTGKRLFEIRELLLTYRPDAGPDRQGELLTAAQDLWAAAQDLWDVAHQKADLEFEVARLRGVIADAARYMADGVPGIALAVMEDETRAKGGRS